MTTYAITHRQQRHQPVAVVTAALLALLLTLATLGAASSHTGLESGTRVRDPHPAPAALVGATTAVTPTNTGDISVFGYDNTAASTVATNTRPALPAGRQPVGALPAGGTADHHLFPQKFRPFFEDAGISIDDFTVTVNHQTTHLRGIHGAGVPELGMPGRWNQRWADFVEMNPGASTREIYQFAGQLMDDYGLSGLPIHPYRK